MSTWIFFIYIIFKKRCKENCWQSLLWLWWWSRTATRLWNSPPPLWSETCSSNSPLCMSWLSLCWFWPCSLDLHIRNIHSFTLHGTDLRGNLLQQQSNFSTTLPFWIIQLFTKIMVRVTHHFQHWLHSKVKDDFASFKTFDIPWENKDAFEIPYFN